MARNPAGRTSKAKSAPRRAPAKRSTAKKSSPKRSIPTPVGVSDKEHLISVIRDTTGCNKVTAKRTLDGLISTITASLKKNQKVQLVGFGSFRVAKRPAHKGRNPRTGEAIRVKASKTVRFKSGQTLRRSI